MIKMVFVIKRRPDLTLEQFSNYWLQKHSVLLKGASKALRMRKYVQSHLVPTEYNDKMRAARKSLAPFDGITEVWYDSLEDAIEARGTPEGIAATQALNEDVVHFVDMSQTSAFVTVEHEIF